MHEEVVKEYQNIEAKFFDALLQDDVNEVAAFFKNPSIFPWKFIERGGYTGK